MSNLRHDQVLHEPVLLLSIHPTDVPRVADDDRAPISDLGDGIDLIRLTYGFIEGPDVPLRRASPRTRHRRVRRLVLPRSGIGSRPQGAQHAPRREELFVLLNRGAANASRFFKLPADQVFEVGTHVEI